MQEEIDDVQVEHNCTQNVLFWCQRIFAFAAHDQLRVVYIGKLKKFSVDDACRAQGRDEK